jgi:hypothetical protein
LTMAQSDRVRYVSTFRAPTEYERQLEEARRRAALAEALAQQEYQPMEGTVAPIPKAAPLVKALQGYLTAREGRKAREAAEEAKGMEADYAQRMLGRMEGGYTYQPNTALEQQMAKRPEETLDQYNQRIAATPFVGQAAPIPDETAAILDEDKLKEVTRQSQYRRAPEEVLGMASTSLGTAALKDRPIMAQRLAQMLETPKTAEFGTTPQFDAEGRAFVVNKAGEVRYLDGVKKPSETPTATQRDYEFARSQGYKGSFEDFRQAGTPKTTVDVRYGAPVAGVDAQGNPVFFQPNPTGGPPSVIEGVRPEGKAPTEGQSTARLYAQRMAQAEPMLQSPPPSFGSRFKENLPGGVGNVMLAPESRQFFQAERNFINAVLRKESGAVISDEEFANARRQYIPQPGDDPATLEQKRQNRELAIQEIGAAGGAGYKPPSIGASQVIDLPPRRR